MCPWQRLRGRHQCYTSEKDMCLCFTRVSGSPPAVSRTSGSWPSWNCVLQLWGRVGHEAPAAKVHPRFVDLLPESCKAELSQNIDHQEKCTRSLSSLKIKTLAEARVSSAVRMADSRSPTLRRQAASVLAASTGALSCCCTNASSLLH